MVRSPAPGRAGVEARASEGALHRGATGAVRGALRRTLLWALTQAVGASLLVGPRPAALLLRRAFARGGAQIGAVLGRHAPDGVEVLVDERYGDEPDMLLDLYRPRGVERPLPLVVWVHGGGFCGGAKHEWAGYYKLLAAAGFAVAAPGYSLAPERRYPTPVRQVMAALVFLQAHAERLRIDPERVALAGDSAGAHIAAQVAASITTPGYAEQVGVAPTLAADRLRCTVLCCGPYDLSLARDGGATGWSATRSRARSTRDLSLARDGGATARGAGAPSVAAPAGADGQLGRRASDVRDRGSAFERRFEQIVLWAYSGRRRFADDPAFAAASVPDHVTAAFPPTLLTVGNADPLRPHSERLAAALARHGVTHETVFYAPEHQPPLGHEYQFDLDGEDAQRFLERLLAFLSARLGEG